MVSEISFGAVGDIITRNHACCQDRAEYLGGEGGRQAGRLSRESSYL